MRNHSSAASPQMLTPGFWLLSDMMLHELPTEPAEAVHVISQSEPFLKNWPQNDAAASRPIQLQVVYVA